MDEHTRINQRIDEYTRTNQQIDRLYIELDGIESELNLLSQMGVSVGRIPYLENEQQRIREEIAVLRDRNREFSRMRSALEHNDGNIY